MKRLLYTLSIALLLTSCYEEINLDKYREENGKDLLTVSSFINADSVIKLSATRTYFYTDDHKERSYVTDLDFRIYIDGEEKGTMVYDTITKLYTSQIKPSPGDAVRISTVYNGKTVESVDTVPQYVRIENIEVERQGPVNMYYNLYYVMTYKITFTDNPDEKNYYFLQYDHEDWRRDLYMGERDFTYEYVFQKLASQIQRTFPDWEAYSAFGLPFTDEGIEGTTHTLIVKEYVQKSSYWSEEMTMNRKFLLSAISKSYYDYIVSVLMSDTDDSGIQGGLIDLGLADPVKVHSNINGGIGILGCYAQDKKTIDVFSLIGPFPE